ncbi:hypothetical protein G9A89_017229 [Geosiphon pyriformis]|nr:hypothetical protein G9A89_017229 [Geosiphon pyriformis]
MSNSWKRVDLLEVQLLLENVNLQPIDSYNIQKKRPKTSGNICNNKFKVATTPDTTTLEYHQSIYTHCKQRFNISDGIEVVKKSVYQYIENHLNSETLATYFQEHNYNIIKYCEEKYPVQSKYFFDFELKTETGNKSKQKVKQHSKTTPNTSILPKTTAKHLQTPEQETKDFQSPKNLTQQQEPISTSPNIIDYLQKNESNYSKSLESEETEPEPEEATENEEKIATAYIAKIPEFTGEDNDTSSQE